MIRKAFYLYSEGVQLGRYLDDDRDDLMVGDYDTDGGCKFEFRITPHNFGRAPGIKLQIFDDAFESLTTYPELFKWMAEFRPTSLDQVQSWLTANGFVNCLAGQKAERA